MFLLMKTLKIPSWISNVHSISLYWPASQKKRKKFQDKKWIPGICLCFLIVIVIWDHGIKIRLHHNRILRIQVFFLDLNVDWCNWCSTYLYRKCKIINHSVIVPFVKHEPTCTYEFHSCLCLILEKKNTIHLTVIINFRSIDYDLVCFSLNLIINFGTIKHRSRQSKTDVIDKSSSNSKDSCVNSSR